MKKFILAFSTLVFCLLALTSCFEECEHDYVCTANVSPTCTERGYKEFTCQICGDVKISECLLPLGHTIVKGETAAPTCSTQGYTVYHCTECDYSYRADYTEPFGHSLVKTTVEPDCDSSGYSEYVCEHCGYSFVSDFTAPLGHAFDSVVSAATCENAGYTTHTCKNCGKVLIDSFVAPLGHKFESRNVKPTCTDPGYTEYTCERCSHTYAGDFVEPLGHDFEDTAVPPTANKVGYTLHDCKNCEYSYQGEYVYLDEILLGAAGEGKGVLARGIDVSHHDEVLDWKAVKAAGIDFAIIRVGTSNIFDETFETNYKEAKAAGVDLGCYIYSEATNVEEAERDAWRVISKISGRKFEYPIYFDIEAEELEELSARTLTEICLAFFDVLLDNGYYPALYTNTNWLTYHLDAERITKHYDIWFARYVSTEKFEAYDFSAPDNYSELYGMWQYTNMGQVDGIREKGPTEEWVDMNVAFKDYPSIIKKYGYNGYSPATA